MAGTAVVSPLTRDATSAERTVSLWSSSRLLRRAALLVVCLAGWQAGALVLHNPVVPTVPEFVAAAGRELPTTIYWTSLGNTVAGWAIGLAVAALVAIPLGMVIGLSSVLDHATRITIGFLQATPSIVLLPLVVLMWGTTLQMKIILVAMAAFWPLLIQSTYGIREVDRVAKETARSYRLRRRDRVLFLYLPSAAPFVATGLRLAASIGLAVNIAAEVLASPPGLGQQILLRTSNADDPASAFVYFITAAVLGMAIAAGFRGVERAVLFWNPAHRKAAAKRARRTGTAS